MLTTPQAEVSEQSVLQAHVDPDLKKQATKILDAMDSKCR